MADRYWVGGSGNWSDTAHWSTSSGGASGASVPISTDNVITDTASNATAYTITIDTAAVGTTFTIGGPAAGAVSFITDASKTRTLTLSGSMTVAATLSVTGNSATNRLLVQSNTLGTARTITAAAVALTNCDFMDITGAGTANWSVNVGSELVTNGTFDVDEAGPTVTGWNSSATFPSTASTSGGEMTVNAAASFGRQVQAISTVIGQQYTVSCMGRRISGTAFYMNISILATGHDWTFTSTASSMTPVPLSLTFTAVQTTHYICLSNHVGAGVHAFDAVSVKKVAGATSLGDALGNSGITFTTAADQYWYTTTTGTKTWSTAGNWFLGSGGTGGAGRVPLPQDNVVFDANSIGAAGTTVNADMLRLGKNINFTGVTNAPTWSNSTANTIYGSVTMASGVTPSGTSGTTFRARSSVTLTSAGGTWTQALTFNGPGATFTLSDDLSTNGALVVTTGTFDDGGYAVTAASITGQTGSTIRRRATNFAATGAAGIVSVTAAAALTGVGAAGSVGTPGVTMDVGLTGVAATTGISITVPTTVLALTGVAATVSIGEIGIGIGLTGVSGTGAAGNVSIPVNGVLTREASRYEFLRTAQTTVLVRQGTTPT